MNREIKFRYWDRVTKNFVYTNEFDWPSYLTKLKLFFQKAENYADDGIEQFSGCYDKTGNEIYEGDIVRGIDFDGKEHFISVIEFVKGSFRTTVKGWQCNSDVGSWAISLYVIGNIHENPELIK